MKKLLPGVIAILLAVGCTAFVNTPASQSSPLTKNEKPTLDPCGEGSKQWFLIYLDCYSQVHLSDIRNPANYHISNTQEVTELCQGSSCVCAIWACPTGTTQDVPDISSGTHVYQQLWNYWYGTLYTDIMKKDEQE